VKVEHKMRDMAARNPARLHLLEKVEKLVDAYNAATIDAHSRSSKRSLP
jgi:hypothetical protein